MTRPLAALPALALLAAPALAQDDGGLYMELGAGLTATEAMPGVVGDAAFKTGTGFNALLGYTWPRAAGELDLSLELEGLWTLQEFEDELLGSGSSLVEDFSTSCYFVNASLAWPYSEEITFYGGLGAGFGTNFDLESQNDASSSFAAVDDSTAVGQAKLGIRYNMGADLAWYLQFRHLEGDSITVRDDFLDQQFDYDLEQDMLEIGMRYGF